MNRDYVTALWALILPLLIPQELFHAFLFEFLEVFNHAHFVARSVTPVQMVKVFAWHVVALETELDFVLGEFLAASLDVAVFASGKTTSAMGYFASFLGDSS
jgi:hypothetical protein